MKDSIYHQKLVDKLKPLRSKEVDHIWVSFDDFRIKFILPPEEDSPLYKFMIFKYRGKLKIAPYEYGKDPYGARYKGLILKDRLIAVSDTFFRIKNEQRNQTINEMLSKYDEASRARIAELLVDSAIGSNKASGIPKPLESQRRQMIEEEKKTLESYHLNYDPEQNERAKDVRSR